jgi:hypothetical protein
MKVCPLGLAGGAGAEASGFLTSFAPAVTAAPNGFANSGSGLDGGDFDTAAGAGLGPVAVGLGLEENLELKLVIQEFLLPGGPCFGSLGFFVVDMGLCASGLSELAR